MKKLPGLEVTQPDYGPRSYPLYELVINTDERRWLSLPDAARWFDQGWCACSLGIYVIPSFGELPREMTEDDRERIRERADEVSAAR